MQTNPERVKVIRRIFEMALKGFGAGKIAATLAEKGVPAFRHHSQPKNWEPRWYSDAVDRLLRDRRLIGERRISTGEVQLDFFPVVIDAGLFFRVQNLRRTASNMHKGGAVVTNSRPRRESPNMFAGILFDAPSGRSYTLRIDRKKMKDGKYKDYPKYICHFGSRKADYLKHDFVELRDALLDILLRENWETIFNIEQTDELRNRIAAAASVYEKAKAKREMLLDIRQTSVGLTEVDRTVIAADYLAAVKAETAAKNVVDELQAQLQSSDFLPSFEIRPPPLREFKMRILETVKRIEIGRLESFDQGIGYSVAMTYANGFTRNATVLLETEDAPRAIFYRSKRPATSRFFA
jgi:hypothetical protein